MYKSLSTNEGNLGESLDDVEALLKKHDDFEKTLASQEEKYRLLVDSSFTLVDIIQKLECY